MNCFHIGISRSPLFLDIPGQDLIAFPHKTPLRKTPRPRRASCCLLLHHAPPGHTHSHSALNAQYLTPTEGACTDMAEDAATATPASLVRISFAAPRPCLRQLQLPTAPNHFCVYLSDVNYTSSTTASFHSL